MCGRFTPVSVEEMRRAAQQIERDAQQRQLQLPLASVMDARQLNTPSDARERYREGDGASIPDAFPSDLAPVIAMGHTRMGVALLRWGFEEPWHSGPLFNARIEKASAPGSVWNEAFQRRRCVIVARAFFERSDYETVPSPKTGRPIKRVYRFETAAGCSPSGAVPCSASPAAPPEGPSGSPLFIAGLYQNGCFTMLTCEPNAQVAPIHKRMPLLLGAGQCAPWLAGRTVRPSDERLRALAG